MAVLHFLQLSVPLELVHFAQAAAGGGDEVADLAEKKGGRGVACVCVWGGGGPESEQV